MSRAKRTTGMKHKAKRNCHTAPKNSFVSGSKAQNNAPNANPAGQPACKMLSHFVFSLLKTVATIGLMKDSTVPLATATRNVLQYNSWKPEARNVSASETIWQAMA